LQLAIKKLVQQANSQNEYTGIRAVAKMLGGFYSPFN